jgi:2,3-bisphosphoglycerate-independent phosphoglycerate mutase
MHRGERRELSVDARAGRAREQEEEKEVEELKEEEEEGDMFKVSSR